LVLGLGLWLTGCGGTSSPSPTVRSPTPANSSIPVSSPVPTTSANPARWVPFLHVAAVLDLTAARSDGRLMVAAGGRLFLLGKDGSLLPFARGRGGYSTFRGSEPYMALATAHPVAGAGCSFPRDAVYVIQPGKAAGVISVSPQGHAQRLADLPGVRPNGIAFDNAGRFGYRLLVTAGAGGATRVFGIDCKGRVTTIASHAPAIEGGIAVAPLSFGSFGGDLVAPDERSGRVWAIGPDGRVRLVARSPLARGPDVGVESAGFVPAGFSQDWAAYVADRRSPGNPHPGTDSILSLSGAALIGAGVSPSDLVIASEGGAQTVVIHCATTCTVRHIADGPRTSHVEGHIVFVPALR
jgi:hypothetical protein